MTSAGRDWQRAVLDFWFGLDEQRHWRVDPELDAAITARFQALWEEQQRQKLETFLSSPQDALAAVILFDQFPRNMFRGDRRAFSTDALARRIARAALERKFDEQLAGERRLFLYLPFEHSEEHADQELCVRLVSGLGRSDWTDFAVKHRDVIGRFGRFPHRNAVLGRQSTPEEEAFGVEPAW